MNFNSLFFPAPTNHYNVTTHFGEMIYIPKDFTMVVNADTGLPEPVLNFEKFTQARPNGSSLHSLGKRQKSLPKTATLPLQKVQNCTRAPVFSGSFTPVVRG